MKLFVLMFMILFVALGAQILHFPGTCLFLCAVALVIFSNPARYLTTIRHPKSSAGLFDERSRPAIPLAG